MVIKGKLFSREKVILLLIQFIILSAAVLYWLFNRGHALQKTFTLDEFLVADSTVVAEDVTTDEIMSQGGVFLETPPLSLDRGVYQIEIHYNANRRGSTVSAHSSSLEESEFHCAVIQLHPNLHHTTIMLELTKPADDVVISADFSGDGYISITNVAVFETSARYKRVLFYAFLLCLLLALIYAFIRSNNSTRGVMLALAGIFGLSSFLIFRDHLLYGDDLFYHLLRIEGIQTGISQGIFPVKIHPVWAQDYGYAVGVFYGNLALYFPAFLRLLGFSVQTAWQFLIGAINLGTVIAFYLSFRRMFHSRLLGILASMLGCLNNYRLIDVYRRAAVGECLSILLFPLILLSFYLIFMETDEKNWVKHSFLTAFSLTGLIQSHVVSCEMVFFIVLTACLIMLRRVFQKYIFRSLTLAAFLSILLNLGFLVPFLDFYNEEILIGSPQWEGCSNDLQAVSLDPLQLFTLIEKNPSPNAYGPAYGIGPAFGAGILLFLLLLVLRVKKCRDDRNFYPALLCFFLGGSLLFMSTKLFPWNALAGTGSIAEKLCHTIEFPWRLLAPGATLLTFSFCYIVSAVQKHFTKPALGGAAVFVCLALPLLLSCVWFLSENARNRPARYIYATEDLDTMLLSSRDFLPTVTDPDKIEAGQINLSEGVSLSAYAKRGTDIQGHVSTGGTEGFIDFPLNYYRYYLCVDASGQSLPVSSGGNGMVRVTFPAAYENDIHIAFREPFHWRIAECFSLICCLGSIAALYMCLGKSRNAERPA